MNSFNETTYPTITKKYVSDNPRYPASSPNMVDGRHMTSYSPQCTRNVAPHQQFNTKQWMIHNANKIIEQSREQQIVRTGANYKIVDIIPPPAMISHTTPFENNIIPSDIYSGIGLERSDNKIGHLFGTFLMPTYPAMNYLNNTSFGLTTKHEGGRNSLRT